MQTEKLYTKREAADERLRCSEITVHRLIKAGLLAHYRIAGKVLIAEPHIEDYLRRVEQRPKEVA